MSSAEPVGITQAQAWPLAPNGMCPAVVLAVQPAASRGWRRVTDSRIRGASAGARSGVRVDPLCGPRDERVCAVPVVLRAPAAHNPGRRYGAAGGR